MTRSPAYQRLLDRLIADEPNGSYFNAKQIGPLTNADLATVIGHEPTVLADACTGDTLVTDVIATLTRTSLNSIESAALLGAAIEGALRSQAQDYLLDEVQTQLALDEERRRADASDSWARRDTRSNCEILADAYGVASLFIG